MHPTTPIKPALRITVRNRNGSTCELVGVPADAAAKAVSMFAAASLSVRDFVTALDAGEFKDGGRSWLDGFAMALTEQAAALEAAIGGDQ